MYGTIEQLSERAPQLTVLNKSRKTGSPGTRSARALPSKASDVTDDSIGIIYEPQLSCHLTSREGRCRREDGRSEGGLGGSCGVALA